MGEKFALVEHYFDPFTFVFTSITAGMEQATNEKAGYGQGALGFAKRYGADFTDGLPTNYSSPASSLPCCMRTRAITGSDAGAP